MKQLLFLLLFPCLALAQYPGNAGQKITLGEQTTADGLVYRGVAADTTRKPSVDTMAYILLDTNTNIIWQYKKAVNNAWVRVGGSISSGVTGVLPVANGGTGITSMPNGYILHGDGTSVDTAIGLFWDRTNGELGIGTNNPAAQLNVFDVTKDATILINGTSAFEQNFHFFNSAFGITKVKSADQIDLKSTNRFTFKTGAAGSQVERIRITPTGMAINLFTVNPTAYLTLGAGTPTASTAPLKFTSGTKLAVPEPGAMEFTADTLFFSTTNLGRKNIAYTDFSNATGTLAVANGGTGITTMPAGYILHGDGTSVDTSLGLFFNRSTLRLGVNTNNPAATLETVGELRINGVATGNGTGVFRVKGAKSNVNGFRFEFNSENNTTQLINYYPGPMIFGNANAEDMRLSADGELNIGYGATDNGAYLLQVKDSVYVGGNVSASAYTTRSDYDLKDEIQNISYGINEVMQMQPVKYTYKSNGSTQLGFIAQDLGVITPEVVSFEDKMSVYYNALIPILTKAIQEQQALIKALEQRILILENK